MKEEVKTFLNTIITVVENMRIREDSDLDEFIKQVIFSIGNQGSHTIDELLKIAKEQYEKGCEEYKYEYSDKHWKCQVFGIQKFELNPADSDVPNWFWRQMQYLILGNKWIKINRKEQ